MPRYRSADWDAIAAAQPNDVTAAKVVSQNGEHYDEEPIDDGQWRSRICPPLKELREIVDPSMRAAFHRYRGQTVGRFTVMGIMARVPEQIAERRAEAVRGSKKKRQRHLMWVLRCACGWHEARTSMRLRNMVRAKERGIKKDHRCQYCDRIEVQKDRYEREGPRPFTDFFEPAPDGPRPAGEGEGVSIEQLAASWAKDEEDGQ